MDQIKTDQFMKKLTKFVMISIWVSSLLITHNFYLCKLTIQLVTHAVDKTYVFLICNGLLVFLTKYSGLISSSSKPVVEESCWSNTDNTSAMLELEYYSVHERATESILAEEVSTQDQETQEDDEEEEDEPLSNNGELEEEEEECDTHGRFREVVMEEDINKKFDEFIRKMKEELRLESKQHLILV